MFVDFNILNQLGSPSINSNTFANRPAAGQTGRLFVSTDTFEIYRDNGTGWDLIGGPGAGTITGTGTATQVAYFTGAQTIGSSANLFWDNTAGALGINTATPGAELDVHGTGTIVQVNATGATSNAYLAFQRTGTGVWRIGDTYNGGSNFFELHNTVLTIDALEFEAATNKSTFLGQQTYASGLATGNQFTYNLTVPNGVNITSPNAVHAVNSYLNLSLGGNTTVPAGARQGLEGNSRISFTGAGTLTMTQGSTVRAFSALSSVYSFNGSAVGTVTHLAGLRICFPDNIGSAINITNNYGILINNQTTGLGTVNYTNRWGIYQEGSSDLNYFAANMLLGSTTNSGERLQVTGQALFTGAVTGTGNSSTYTVTAASGLARSKSITSTLVAAANNDVLVGLDINPTFTNGAFTGVTNLGLRTFRGFELYSGGASPNNHYLFSTSASSTDGTLLFRRVGTANGTLAFALWNMSFIDNNTNGEQRWNVGPGSCFPTIWSNGAEAARFSTGRNFLIGTTTDAGFRLDCNGTARIQGVATLAAQATNIGSALNFGPTNDGGNYNAAGTGWLFSYAIANNANRPGLVLYTGTLNPTSGTTNLFGYYFITSFSPSSGNATLNFISISNTAGNAAAINTTGTYSGIIRGLFFNPNLVSTTGADIRAIETATGNLFFGTTSGSTSIGATTTINASAILQVTSTTQGFLPPRMTTAQKNAIAAPAAGLTIYDTTLNKLCVFTGVNWETVTSV